MNRSPRTCLVDASDVISDATHLPNTPFPDSEDMCFTPAIRTCWPFGFIGITQTLLIPFCLWFPITITHGLCTKTSRSFYNHTFKSLGWLLLWPMSIGLLTQAVGMFMADRTAWQIQEPRQNLSAGPWLYIVILLSESTIYKEVRLVALYSLRYQFAYCIPPINHPCYLGIVTTLLGCLFVSPGFKSSLHTFLLKRGGQVSSAAAVAGLIGGSNSREVQKIATSKVGTCAWRRVSGRSESTHVLHVRAPHHTSSSILPGYPLILPSSSSAPSRSTSLPNKTWRVTRPTPPSRPAPSPQRSARSTRS